jgi:hypothetical protein
MERTRKDAALARVERTRKDAALARVERTRKDAALARMFLVVSLGIAPSLRT